MDYEEILRKRWDVTVIGGGPGGLGCALYTSRAELSTLVIEKAFCGGLIALTTEVENYPAMEPISGMELGQRMEAQVRKFGAEIILKEVTRVDHEHGDGFAITLGDDNQLQAETVVVATGSAPRRLPAKGEKEFYGRGMSYCATCDGAFFRDKEVVVVGGGESAFQEGHFLTNFARKVTLVHRREGFRATPLAIRRARDTGKWEEKLNYVVDEILGKDTVKGVLLRHIQTDAHEEYACDGVFAFIGYEPASQAVAHLVETDEEGYIVVDSRMRASQTGIWCAGDIIKGAKKQMVISAGAGATAAMDIREYLADKRG